MDADQAQVWGTIAAWFAAAISISGAAVSLWNKPRADWAVFDVDDQAGFDPNERGLPNKIVTTRFAKLTQCGDGTAFAVKASGRNCRANILDKPFEAVCKPGDFITVAIDATGGLPENAAIVITWTHPPTWRRRWRWYRPPRMVIEADQLAPTPRAY